MQDLELKRQELDRLYHSGLMTESQAEDYREAYLKVSITDLMSATEVAPYVPKPQKLGTAQGGVRHIKLGDVRIALGTFTGFDQSRVSKGDRPRVKPPTTYKDRFNKVGRKRYGSNPLALGYVRLSEMVASRHDEYEAMSAIRDNRLDARVRPESFQPNAEFDSDFHGSSHGSHAVCTECSVLRGQVILGSECSCTRPDRIVLGTTERDGVRVHVAWDRITGEQVETA